MVRTTRQAIRLAAQASSTATPISNNSPGVSSRQASTAADTPPTSEDELLISKEASFSSRITSKKSLGKRSRKDDDVEMDDEALGSARSNKRANRAYVAVPSTPQRNEKGLATRSTPSRKTKGKAKAVELSEDEVEGSEEEANVLEYDEDPDESDASGSEFQESSQDEAQDEEDEEVMLDAAVRMSLQTDTVGGASSSRGSRNASQAAIKAAEAAERRIRNSGRRAVKEDSDLDLDLSAASDEDSESDAPLISKAKGKSRATVRETAAVKSMTISEMQRRNREAKKKRSKGDPELILEEKAMKKQLGRRLTHAEKTTLKLKRYHPELKDVWGDLEQNIPIIKPEKAPQPESLKLTLLPFQQESLYWMQKQEKGPWKGGMLADEMGMGKTIQVIALLIATGNKPNLIVAPTVAIMQWKNEIITHTDGMKVLVWHGASRITDVNELKKHDIVLTTYAVLESSYRKQQYGFKRKGALVKEQSPVHKIHWKRIVLDEAHNIKERSTSTAKAAFELKADYRWCLSGTPLQNRVGELYSLIRFLGGDPFAFYFCKMCDCKSLHWKFSDKRTCDDCEHSPMQHVCLWNNEILTPIQKNGMGGPGRLAFKKLHILLDRMMLRRTKIQRADDLGLPPRTVIVRRDYFSPEEKELYLSLFSDAKRQFTTYLDQGTVLNNYSNIFSLLTRMRQMACHPDLVLRSKTNSAQFAVDDAGEAIVCRLCNDVAEDAIHAKCRHLFDRECIKRYIEASPEDEPTCPVCHVPLTIDLEAPAVEFDAEVVKSRQGILGRLNLDTWTSSSKIEALVEELTNLRLQDATTKSIVFSQFVNFLDLIAFRLQRAGFNVCRLEGTMSPQARDATIQHFMNTVDVTVFLVSLKAGGVALNLTEASRVYLMDSWWNPAVEYQAMDRIHRLGQRRPVQAIKLVVEDSIESRIVQLQEKKSAMVDATLSTDDSAMGRLTPEDLGFLFRL